MRRHTLIAIIALAAHSVPAIACAQTLPTRARDCSLGAANPVIVVDLPGSPFQAIPTADGCHVFVSLVGPVEPGDPRRAPQPGAPKGGVAVVALTTKAPSIKNVLTLEGSPYGMTLTHDGQLLIVTSDDRVAFIDTTRLIANSADAVVGYLNDAPMAGRMYANVTRDDRWLFLSDESAKAISVVDLAKARASGFNTSAVVGQIPAGRAPIALTFSPDEKFLYTTSQVAPDSHGWAPTCTPPPTEVARQGSNYAEGAILIVDVARATRDPARSVVGTVAAGCNPVRLVLSPRGDIAYVSARTDNAILAFDTSRLIAEPSQARLGRVQVGSAPVGLAVFNDGARLAVTNSDRFSGSNSTQSITILDTTKISSGDAAIIGSVRAGVFPRELRVTENQQTLLLTNFGSKTLAIMDIARLPIEQQNK